MKNTLLVLAFGTVLSFCTMKAGAQGMAVNTTGAAANSSAMLDVSSTTQGVLIPRMTSAQRTAISSPATGLLVYQTDATAGFYFYNGSAWTSLNSGLSNVTTQGNTFNGASQLVQLDGSSQLPAVSGTNLTNLNASNISSGTVPTARLGSGTASSTTFLRGDNTWATPSGGSGTVTSVSSGVLTSGTTAFTDTIFHTTVVNSTTTPSIFYTFNNAQANTVLTNSTNAPSVPVYGKVVPNALYASSGTPSSSTYYRGDGSWQSISSGGYCFAGSMNTNASTLYTSLNSSLTGTIANSCVTPMPVACTLDDFYFSLIVRTAGGTGNNTFTGTIYVNGSPTTMTVSATALTTDAAGTRYTTQIDNTHTQSISAGDIVEIQWTASNTSGPLCYVNWAIKAH